MLDKEKVRAWSIGHWPLFVIIPAILGFFFFASSFNYLSQKNGFAKWLSPDETANYTAAKLYAETGNLAFFEKYNLVSKDIIHPRSFRSDWGWIKPVSFIGLPLLYGKIASIFGIAILPYLTPLFGAIGLFFFYLFVKRIFGTTNAIISTLLASVFPIYVYYSARSMFHNVLFMSALMVGLYLSVRMGERREKGTAYFRRHGYGFIFSLLAGISVGIALIARTSELLWVGPLFFVLYLFNIRRLGVMRPFLFLWGIFLVFLPVLYWNQVLYGWIFASGYPELNNSLVMLGENSSKIAATAVSGKFAQLVPFFNNIKLIIFHFGFKPAQSYKMFNAYVREMFPWLFWSMIAGLASFLIFFKEYSRKRWLFLLGWLSVSLILILYYGSWVFFDNPDPRSFTIGNSYTRYWLPVYFGALPFASLALIKITSALRSTAAMWALRAAAIAVIATLSVQFVWNDPAEGLAVSIQKQNEARVERETILSLTEANSAIITRYHDKLLFPERKVIIGLFNDPNMIDQYAELARRLPIYYYNFSLTDADLAYLNDGDLKLRNVSLNLVQKITDRFSLYRLKYD